MHSVVHPIPDGFYTLLVRLCTLPSVPSQLLQTGERGGEG